MENLGRYQHASILYQPINPRIKEQVSRIAKIGGRDSLDDLIDKVTRATHGNPRKRALTFYIPTPPFALED